MTNLFDDFAKACQPCGLLNILSIRGIMKTTNLFQVYLNMAGLQYTASTADNIACIFKHNPESAA